MPLQKIIPILAIFNFLISYVYGAASAPIDEAEEITSIPRERFLVIQFSSSPADIALQLTHQEGKSHLILIGEDSESHLFEDDGKRDLVGTLLTHSASGTPLEGTPYKSVSLVGGRIDQTIFNWIGDTFLAPEGLNNTLFPYLEEINFADIQFGEISTENYASNSIKSMELSGVQHVPHHLISRFPNLESFKGAEFTVSGGSIAEFLDPLSLCPIKNLSLHSIPLDFGGVLTLIAALKEKPLNYVHISNCSMDREKLFHLATLGAFTPTHLNITIEDSFVPTSEELREITRAWEAYPSAHLRLRLGSAP
jgi:hypothetical protein